MRSSLQLYFYWAISWVKDVTYLIYMFASNKSKKNINCLQNTAIYTNTNFPSICKYYEKYLLTAKSHVLTVNIDILTHTCLCCLYTSIILDHIHWCHIKEMASICNICWCISESNWYLIQSDRKRIFTKRQIFFSF